MIVEQIFTSFIAQEMLELDNVASARFCYDKIKNDPGTLENQGMISYEEGHSPLLAPLVDTVMDRFKMVHERCGFDTRIKQELINAWININPNSVIGAPHAHQVATFSAVYYVQASEGSGNLDFMTPITAHRYTIPDGVVAERNHYNSDMWSIKPVEGKLIIFPSWLYHFVRPNTDNKDRITIAFNSLFEHRVGRQ